MRYILVLGISVALGFIFGGYAPRPVQAAIITFLSSLLLFRLLSM